MMDSATLQRRSITGMVAAGIELGPERLVVGTRLDDVRVMVPTDVRVSNGSLLWRLGDGPGWVTGELDSGALSAFTRLAHEADDEPFGEFARRYGVLGLLPDGRPGTVTQTFPPHMGSGEDAWFSEPLDLWRRWAICAHATLALAAALRGDVRIDPWEVLYRAGFSSKQLRPTQYPSNWLIDLPMLILNVTEEFDHEAKCSKPRSLIHQRLWLGHHVARTWLGQAALAPDVMWTETIPRATLALSRWFIQPGLGPWPENTLFSVLAVQIAAAICSRHYLATCDCGEVFERKTSPRADQPLRCPACARAVHREQKTRSAAKRRAEGRKT